MEAFCTREKFDINQIIAKLDGIAVSLDDTPSTSGMLDGDTLVVQLRAPVVTNNNDNNNNKQKNNTISIDLNDEEEDESNNTSTTTTTSNNGPPSSLQRNETNFLSTVASDNDIRLKVRCSGTSEFKFKLPKVSTLLYSTLL